MGGWNGGEMWVWMVVGLLVVILLAVGINKLYRKNSRGPDTPVK